MRHNKKVTENIDAIKADVEAATSQADLIQVIRSVQNHPGPLDYNDRIVATIKWLVLFAGIMGLYFNGASGGFYGDIGMFLDIAMNFSSAWVPAIGAVLIAKNLERKGKMLPLPELVNRQSVRLGIIAVAATAVFAVLPFWSMLYWTVIYTIMGLIRTIGFLILLDDYSFGQEITMGMLAIAASIWLWQGKRIHWREPLSERIQLLDSLFNNNLKPMRFNKVSKAKALGEQFQEFVRGNHSRKIEALYQGKYQGSVHSFDFQLYHFHFVDQRTETYTDSEGNTKTRTVYKHYHRHGLLVNFPYSQSVTLSGDSRLKLDGESYSTASNTFNRHFKVSASEELQAARFLTPAVVEGLSDIGEHYHAPVIEISDQGQMCIAFDNDDLLKTERKYGLDNPEAFAKEIAGHAELKKLDALLNTVHDVLRLSDNNFA
ncbi:DUF3137 domain-containing protein [Ferrimonas aestuarii]|uniref:DUF3137 domain-containing protein n=1 Tax=Ferrimonas aestuarii TaxID=2569539 RepID=A0A4U1BQJ7_9GAMM|nr:DUF3137 domain-containing protein [Ferrimonas aestuarii]TKB56602.1 DUF3137 domain-containing protein [Ferrimonas aestuarii]